MKNVLGDRKLVLLLVGPALLVYSAITLLPIVWSFVLSFFDGGLISGFEFNGIDNYVAFFQDPKAGEAVWFTIRYAIAVTAGQIITGYALALVYIFYLRRASAFVRTIFFFPVLLPTVAVALLFQQMFQLAPTTGPANALVQALGGPGVDFLGNPTGAFWVIILMDVWRGMGFFAVILYAGLLDIPDDILEAARIDGAGTWGLIRRIVLPLCLPILLSSIIFSISGNLKVFDSVVALTSGGPGTTTTPLTLYMFTTSFNYGNYGYGSTIAVMLGILCLLFTVLIFRATRRDLTES